MFYTDQYTAMLFSFLKRKPAFYPKLENYYQSAAKNSLLKQLANNLDHYDEQLYLTNKPIQFKYDIPIGISNHAVKTILGKPDIIHNENLADGHVVWYYHKPSNAIHTKYELHFFENTFIAGFLSFDVHNTNKKLRVLHGIFRKFLHTAPKVQADQVIIIDEKDNFFKLIDSVYLTLAYSNNAPKYKRIIQQLAIPQRAFIPNQLHPIKPTFA